MTGVDKDQVEERLTTGILGQWYVVAKSAQVKRDKPHAVKALGRNLVLWRDTGGRLHCLEDYCPHRGARLSRGEVNQDNISCRYHGVTLDGTGTIVRVPAMPGCALEGRKAVDSYSVIEANDGIFVYFPSKERREPPALESAGGVLRSGLEQHPVHGPLAVQLSLRLRQFRRSDACLLPARRLVHARVRRQAGRDARRKARRRLLHRPRRAEGRQPRLDPRGRRRHAGLLPARHSVSGRRRSRRAVPDHRLCDAGR